MAFTAMGSAASANDAPYPSHSVRWIVPYTAGGATDVLSRLICQQLSDRLGQTFIVENKPGAGSNIGTQTVINSPPDGYTLLLTSTANAINASFDPTLPYDFAKGIAPDRAGGGKLAEGAFTAPVLLAMARGKAVEMPICEAIAAVLDGTLTVDGAIESLLTRPFKAE